MDIKVDTLPKSEVKITIELTEEETKKLMEKAAKQVSEMVKVPGFRSGQVPLDILKKHVKDGAIEGHMIDIALPETYTEAVKKEDIKVISKPEIKILTDNPLKYEAKVAVYPDVKISGYEKVKIKKQEVKVEDKDVEEVLKDIQKRRATYSKVDRGAEKGDRVEIDFEGFDEGGAPLENTSSKHHPVVLGEGSLVPGFEEELIGLKGGEKKEFKVSFPKDYFHKPFKGKKVQFKVEVHQVDEMKLPEINDEFVKQITGEEKPVDEMKKSIKENLKTEREQGEKVRRENEFLDAIADMVKVEIPAPLIEEEIDSMMEEFENELSGKNITLQQYLEGSKKEVKDLRDQRTKEAEKRLRLRFGLQQVFEQEKIEVTEENIRHEVDHIKSLYPENEREKIESEYTKGAYLKRRLENKLKMEKLFETYLSK